MDPNNPNRTAYVNPKLRKIQEQTQQMYEIFKKEVDVDTVMTQSEFEKNAPLYRKSTLPTDRNMTIDEVADLAAKYDNPEAAVQDELAALKAKLGKQ